MGSSAIRLNTRLGLEPLSIFKAGIYIILLGCLYYSSLQWLVLRDWAKADSSHCMLIPLIVLYLIWEKRLLLSQLPSTPSFKGFVWLIPGLGLFFLGDLAGEYFTSYLSLWLVVLGICQIHLGWEKIKLILFPLVFSLTMFPFPSFINNRITLGLKLISSKLGVLMMQAYGMSVHRQGNVIDLGFTKLQVVDACSGLRYLFPMIVLSILVVYFHRMKPWKKLVVVLSSIPLTIITNALRIALTGILSEQFGTKSIEGFFHDFEGWLIFMLTLGVMLAEIWILNRLFKAPQKRIPEPEVQTITPNREKGDARANFRQPQFLLVTLLLAMVLAISQSIEFRENVPILRPLKQFPMEVGKWHGKPQKMETMIINELDFSDYLMADYRTDKGKGINFYVAYYESQRKGESIHSPASCLRGGGWVFENSGTLTIPLENGNQVKVMRAIIKNGAAKQVAYYWFPSRGRDLTNAIEMKFYNFWDALTRQRTDGALVRIITSQYPDETIEESEGRLKNFTRLAVPKLFRFLPR